MWVWGLHGKKQLRGGGNLEKKKIRKKNREKKKIEKKKKKKKPKKTGKKKKKKKKKKKREREREWDRKTKPPPKKNNKEKKKKILQLSIETPSRQPATGQARSSSIHTYPPYRGESQRHPSSTCASESGSHAPSGGRAEPRQERAAALGGDNLPDAADQAAVVPVGMGVRGSSHGVQHVCLYVETRREQRGRR
jgi:hypothetical protein